MRKIRVVPATLVQKASPIQKKHFALRILSIGGMRPDDFEIEDSSSGRFNNEEKTFVKGKALATLGMAIFAWILWQFQSQQGEQWDVISGHVQYEECRNDRALWLGLKMKLKGAIKIGPNEIYLTEDTKRYRSGTLFRYVCLPESLDPRPENERTT